MSWILSCRLSKPGPQCLLLLLAMAVSKEPGRRHGHG